MASPYATPAELATFLGDTAPDDAERLLEMASDLMDATVTASFDTDDVTELPAEPAIAEALRKATCAQVQYWGEVGEEHDIDGLAGSSFMVTGAAGYQGKRGPVVAERAKRYLRKARLLEMRGM